MYKVNIFYNNINVNNNNIYLVLTDDNYLKYKIKNEIILKIKKKFYNIEIENIYLDEINNYINIYNKIINISIIDISIIYIINFSDLNKLDIFIKNIIKNLFIKKNKFLIFCKKKYIYYLDKKKIFYILKNINIYYIEECNLNYDRFVFWISLFFKIDIKNINNKVLKLLYIIYNKNILIILKILNILINKNTNNFNIYKIIYNKNINVSYKSWIYISILGYYNLSNFILFNIRKNNENIILKLLNFLQKNIYFIIYNIKYNNVLLNKHLNKFNINIKFKNILIDNIFKFNINNIYKILKILCDIEIYIKNFEYLKYKDFIWNKLEIISIILYKISKNKYHY